MHIKPSVCACHCFACILPPNPPVAKPLSASGWLFCYSAWHDHYHRSPLSICLVASQQHFTSSPLIQLLFPSLQRPPLALPTHFTRPSTHPSLALCSRPLCWLLWHLPFRRVKRDKPLSNRWPFSPPPPSSSLVLLTHSVPNSQWISETKNKNPRFPYITDINIYMYIYFRLCFGLVWAEYLYPVMFIW